MSHRRDDRAPSGSARGRRSGWMVAFLAASLGLLGVILAVPAPRARAAYRREIVDTAARVLDRLTRHPHRVLRRYLTTPLLALQVGPPVLQELDAAGFLVKRGLEDRIHTPGLLG